MADIFDEISRPTDIFDEISTSTGPEQVPTRQDRDKEFLDMASKQWHYTPVIKDDRVKKAITQGFERAGVGMVESLAGAARMEAEVGGALRDKMWKTIGIDRPEYSKKLDKSLLNWGKTYDAAVQTYYKENADKGVPIEGETFVQQSWDVLSHPTKLLQLGIESVPLMLEMALPGGTAIAAMDTAGKTYSEARRDGNDPNTAMARSILTGVPEALIERWTFNKKIGLFKNFGKLKGMRKALWEMGKAYLRGGAEEGSQQVNRNFWRWVFTDRSQHIFEGVKQSMATGSLLETAFSGLAMGASTIKSDIPKQQKIRRVEQIRDGLLESPDLNAKQREEIVSVAEQVMQEVEDGTYEDFEATSLTSDQTIGIQYGIAPQVTNDILTNAENRYRELKLKDTGELSRREKRELSWLSRATPTPKGTENVPQRANIEALLSDATSDKPVLRGVYDGLKQQMGQGAPKKSKRHLKAEAHKIKREVDMDDATYREIAKDTTDKDSMSKMTAKEMNGFVEALKEYTGSGNVEITPDDYQTPVVVAGQTTTVAKILDAATEKVKDLEPAKKSIIPKPGAASSGKATEKTAQFTMGQKNSSRWYLAEILDNGDKDGPYSTVLGKGIDYGIRISDGHVKDIHNILYSALEEAGITPADLMHISVSNNPRLGVLKAAIPDYKTIRTRVEIGGKSFDLTPAHLIDFYLATNQDDGVRHALGGGFEVGDKKTGPLGDTDIKSLRRIVEENSKMKASADILSATWNDHVRDGIANVMLRIDGVDKLTNDNWWGLEVVKPDELPGQRAQFKVDFLENKSFFKDRTRSVLPIRLRDAFNRFDVFESAAAEYIGMAEPMRVVRTLLNNRQLTAELEAKGYGDTRGYLLDLFKSAQGESVSRSWLGSWIQKHIGGMYRGALASRPEIAFSNFSSIMNYGSEASWRFAAKAVRNAMNPANFREALDKSDFFWNRFMRARSSLELGEMAAQDSTLQLFTGKTLSDKNLGGWALKIGDGLAILVGRETAKLEFDTIKKGRQLGRLSSEWWADKRVEDIEEGSQDYDLIIEDRSEYLWRTQPHWKKWNRSGITSEKGAISRSFFLFRSFHEASLTKINQILYEYRKSEQTISDKAKASQRLGAIMASYTTNWGFRTLYYAALAGGLPTASEALMGLAGSLFRLFPILGTALETAMRRFIAGLEGGSPQYTGEPIGSFPIQLANSTVNTSTNFAGAAGHYLSGDEEKAKEVATEAAIETIENLAIITGTFPAYTTRRIRKGNWLKEDKGGTSKHRGRGRRVK